MVVVEKSNPSLGVGRATETEVGISNKSCWIGGLTTLTIAEL